MSMPFDEFDALIDGIMAQGFNEETAAMYAALVGDTPILNADGRWSVVDRSGKLLAIIDPVY